MADVQAYYEAMDTLQSNWFQYIHNNTVLPTAAEVSYTMPDMTFTKSVEFLNNIVEVPRLADTLVGIHLPLTAAEPITVGVEMGDIGWYRVVSQLSLFPGNKQLIFDNATCCHMYAVQYTMVKLRLFSGPGNVSCTLIYHNYSTSVGRHIAMTSHVYLIPVHLRTTYSRQHPLIQMYAGFLDMKEGGESDVVSAVKEGANELPHIWKASRPASNWWHIPGGSCMQRVAVLKEELMASAWHPKRMVEWCWDEDEKRGSNELQMTFVTRTQPYRLWQDEVLVTDASDRGHIEGLASIRLFTGQRVKFVAMTGRGFVTVSGKDGRFIHFDAEKPYWIEHETV